MSARATNDWTTVAAPSATSTYGYQNSVSCWSATGCISIGASTSNLAGGGGIPTGEEWNGSSWSVLPSVSLPSGVTSAGLVSISCTSASFCMAVGNYYAPPTTNGMIVAKWDGTSWTATTVDTPAGYTNPYLTGVSCLAGNDCTAVGGEDSSFNPHVVVEHWDGNAWSQDATVPAPSTDPNGWSSLQVAGVSCVPGSSDVCTIVGSYRDSNFAAQSFAMGENWPNQASGWQLQTMAAPPSSGTNPEPAGVACPSMSACFATGSYTDTSTGNAGTLAEKWDGGSWTTQTAPSISDQFGGGAALDGVSCNSATSCVTVGYSGYSVIALRWDGATWTTQDTGTTANNSGAGYLYGISCPASSSSYCMTAGFYYDAGQYQNALINQALADQFDGSAWTSTGPVTLPGQLGSDQLSSTSCVSGACAAVGFETGGGSWSLPVAEMWDGSSWTLRHVPLTVGGGWTGSRLSSVSCWAANGCIAVGASGYSSSHDDPLSEHWNGSSWTMDSASAFPVPASGTNTAVAEGLKSISCWATNACMAIAAWNQGSGFMSERWNGSSWTATAIPDPPVPSGATQTVLSQLSGISCASDGTCMAVGMYGYVPNGQLNADFAPIAEQWNGSSWSASVPTQSTNVTGGYFNSVSCGASGMCMAVGRVSTSTSSTPSGLAMEWTSGGGWSDTSASGPSGGGWAELQSVSCSSATACTAVGSSGSSPTNTLTENWGGSGWTTQSPDPGISGALLGVACTSATACFATGTDGAGSALIQSTGMTPPSTDTLEVSHGGAGTGTVTGADPSSSVGGNSIDCWDHDMCEGVYGSGDSVTLSATPSTGSTFTGWSGGGCSGTGPCSVPMSQAQDVTATFSLASGGGGGTTSTTTALAGSPNPSQVGQQVEFTASVSPSSAGGTVKFTDNGSIINHGGSGDCTAITVSSGQAHCFETIESAGAHTIVATYSGDTTYAGSSHTITQNVNSIGGGGGGQVPAWVSPSLPTLTGDTTPGGTLTESHATWTNNPTSYQYQWSSGCDQHGSFCTTIGSWTTTRTYTVSSNDIGYTIRVRERATNTTGTGSASPYSAPSQVVTDPTALSYGSGTGGGSAAARAFMASGFAPGMAANITGYLCDISYGFSCPSSSPQPSSIPQGVITNGQEIFRGSNLSVAPSCWDPDTSTSVSNCTLKIVGPVNTAQDQSVSTSSSMRMPTVINGQYYATVTATDGGGQKASVTWGYVIGNPPSSSQVTSTDTTAASSAASAALGSLTGLTPGIAYNEIINPANNTVVGLNGSDGSILPVPKIVAAGGANIVAAGGANIVAAGGANIIAAGAGNIVAAGGANIVAAGGANAADNPSARRANRVLAHGAGVASIISDYFLVDGNNYPESLVAEIKDSTGAIRWDVVSANATSGYYDPLQPSSPDPWNEVTQNIVAAGGANIVAAGGANIIAAGAGNLVSAQPWNTPIGGISGAGIVSAGGANAVDAQAAAVAAHRAFTGFALKLPATAATRGNINILKIIVAGKPAKGLTLTTGGGAIPRFGKHYLVYEGLTPKGRKLLVKLAKKNRTRLHHHKKPIKLRLRVVSVLRPLVGSPVTVTKTFTIVPGKKH